MAGLGKSPGSFRPCSECQQSAVPAELPHSSNRHKGLEAAVGHRLLERRDLEGRK